MKLLRLSGVIHVSEKTGSRRREIFKILNPMNGAWNRGLGYSGAPPLNDLCLLIVIRPGNSFCYELRDRVSTDKSPSNYHTNSYFKRHDLLGVLFLTFHFLGSEKLK